MARYLMAVVWLGLVLLPGQAKCDSFSAHGVTFSDELGGFVIESVTGQGTLADPFVIVERMTNPAGGTLLFRADPAFGNPLHTLEQIGFALVKVIKNGTGVGWSGFELELQSKLGVPSDNRDELSFGQGSDVGRPFTASSFASVTIIDEPFDRIEFGNGSVPPGGQTTLRIVVTQPASLHQAYLVQRPGVSGVESEAATPYETARAGSGQCDQGKLAADPPVRRAGTDTFQTMSKIARSPGARLST